MDPPPPPTTSPHGFSIDAERDLWYSSKSIRNLKFRVFASYHWRERSIISYKLNLIQDSNIPSSGLSIYIVIFSRFQAPDSPLLFTQYNFCPPRVAFLLAIAVGIVFIDWSCARAPCPPGQSMDAMITLLFPVHLPSKFSGSLIT